MRYLLIASILFISLAGFTRKAADLRQKLEQIRDNVLADITIEADAVSKIDGFIDMGVKEYKNNKSTEKFQEISANFKKLADAIASDKEPVNPTNPNKGYKITLNSIKKTVTSICPLYPFCK